MLVYTERSVALVTMRAGSEAEVSIALAAMGLDLPRTGRFTEGGGLLLARFVPLRVLAMRCTPDGVLVDELAPLSAVAGLVGQTEAWAGVRICGADCATRLSGLLPPDMHPERFGPGRCALVHQVSPSGLVLRHGPALAELLCSRAAAACISHLISPAMDTIGA